jgi:hypothetical protein
MVLPQISYLAPITESPHQSIHGEAHQLTSGEEILVRVFLHDYRTLF